MQTPSLYPRLALASSSSFLTKVLVSVHLFLAQVSANIFPVGALSPDHLFGRSVAPGS